MAKFKIKNINKPNSAKEQDIDQIVSQSEGVNLVLKNEIKEFIPPLSPEEYGALEESILSEGVRDPLCYWVNNQGENVLIDGHNRYSISKKHNLSYPTKRIQLEGFEAVKDWMLSLQLGRRNLTPSQLSYLRGLQYDREKSGIGRPIGWSKDKPDNLSDLNTTAERLAKKHGVTSRTIERDMLYAKGLEMVGKYKPNYKKEILAGKLKIKKSTLQEIGLGKIGVEVVSVNKSTKPTTTLPINEDQKLDIEIAKENFALGINDLFKSGLGEKQIRSIFLDSLKESLKEG